MPIFIIFLLSSYFAFSQFSGGSGTQSDPYKITSRQDMEELADSVNDGNSWSRNKYFKLMNDITDSIRTVIGQDVDGEHFQGHFDGNNKKINVAIVSSSDANYTGLFERTYNSVIENLTICGYIIGNEFVGGISGQNFGIIKNCNNYASVTAIVPNSIGGIVGKNDGNIQSCNNYGNINATSGFIGGIAGENNGSIVGENNASIKNCNNYANISINIDINSYGCIGGVAGHNESSIMYCINTGAIRIKNDNIEAGVGVGGIVGCGTSCVWYSWYKFIRYNFSMY